MEAVRKIPYSSENIEHERLLLQVNLNATVVLKMTRSLNSKFNRKPFIKTCAANLVYMVNIRSSVGVLYYLIDVITSYVI